MTEHPTAADYANLHEREAASCREQALEWQELGETFMPFRLMTEARIHERAASRFRSLAGVSNG